MRSADNSGHDGPQALQSVVDALTRKTHGGRELSNGFADGVPDEDLELTLDEGVEREAKRRSPMRWLEHRARPSLEEPNCLDG